MCKLHDTAPLVTPCLLETSDLIQSTSPSCKWEEDKNQPVDQAFMISGDRLVDRVHTAERNSQNRSAVLVIQIKELESKIEEAKVERQ